MSWMEEHMFLSDCFPKEANIRPACNVINCEVFFKDGLPAADKVEKLVKGGCKRSQLGPSALLSFVRFSAVPDVKSHGWKMVDVDLANHIFTYKPVENRRALDAKVDEVAIGLSHVISLYGKSICFRPPLELSRKDCVVFRCHHTVADGISLVQLLDKVATTPDGKPIKFVNYKAKKAAVQSSILRKDCIQLPLRVRSFVSNLRQAQQPLETDYGFDAPLSHRSGDMRYSGSRKSICFKPFSLDYVKAIKNKAPGKITVNDVLLGAMDAHTGRCSNRFWGANPPPEGDRLGNNWSFASADLSKAIRAEDSVARVEITDAVMNRLKESLDSTTSNFITNKLMPLLPPSKAQHSTKDLYARHTAIFSNVPGPQLPCCVGGKEIEAVYPIFLTLVEQVIVMSYNGKFYFNTTPRSKCRDGL
ncbi:hypothetical protein FOZ60_008341 [Perkinsus olseni]|uniref:O-acyltransferase WSD1 C-terminal domain-containing protein n=1 Tax=Perkinsus olseni TaxID=32597 RepID=A0A7J6NKP4_PEROL|nr:hypothetical protein FOZ60_008341 [Perkinsus olseni]